MSAPVSLGPRRQRAVAAWERWARAAGPWRRWTLCLPLLAPGLDEIAPSERNHAPATPGARRLADALAPTLQAEPTLAVFDLPPTLGVAAAARLARDGTALPLVHLARWPYREAILPAQPLVDLLCWEARRLPSSVDAHSVVLVLDGERSRPLGGRSPRDRRADNRHQQMPTELPSAAAILTSGIRQVLDVRDTNQVPPADIAVVYAEFARAGLLVSAWTDQALLPASA